MCHKLWSGVAVGFPAVCAATAPLCCGQVPGAFVGAGALAGSGVCARAWWGWACVRGASHGEVGWYTEEEELWSLMLQLPSGKKIFF